MRVVSHQPLTHNVFELVLAGSLARQVACPGQFVNVRIGHGQQFLLRRPISIAAVNKDELTIIYRTEGAGTKELSRVKVNDKVDVLGPLGSGYDLNSLQPGQTALLVGGGIGVPPLYQLARELNAKGVKTIHVLGFRTSADVFYAQEFAQLGQTIVCTNPVPAAAQTKAQVNSQTTQAQAATSQLNSEATNLVYFTGFVTQAIAELNLAYDKFYACGPHVMLEALAKQEADHEGYVSLEERMACGVGACYACVCQTKDPTNTLPPDSPELTKRICLDGPVFKATQLW